MRIEIHVLQNFAPSNLNRDDTGSPKDAEFGGHRRARVSSQCLKRAVRKYFASEKLLPPEALADRTKRLATAVAKVLADKGRATEAANQAAKAGVSAFLAKSEVKDGDHKTPYLLFLGQTEITRFSDLVDQHFDAFSKTPEAQPAEAPAVEGKAAKKQKKGKGEDALKVPDGFAKAIDKLLDGGKAADLALFGRMLADLPSNNVDAACQVAHSISTNKIHSMEMDYYTAVDDLKPDDTAGADMIGTVEFNSACFYRYANLDVSQLATNLQNDTELSKQTAQAFLKAFVHATPTGKQNTFAAQNPPSLVFAVVRTGGPVSLTNAFVKPVAPTDKLSLVERSIAEMDKYYGRLVMMYGESGLVAAAVSHDSEVELYHLRLLPKDASKSTNEQTPHNPVCVLTLEKLIESTVMAAFPGGAA